jgi:ribonuclease Z
MSNELNALWKVWDDRPAIKIPNTEYTLRGFSIAALRTNFYIKELNIMLDGGLSSHYAPLYIFITHAHSDHIASLPFHLYSGTPERKVQIYVPEQSSHNLAILIKSVLNVNDGYQNPEFAEMSTRYYDIIPLKPNKFELFINNKKFMIEVIECFHGIPCLGYGFCEVRNKLKEEYAHSSGKEIGILRKQGVSVSYESEYPFLCFLGDTSPQILHDVKIEKYKNLMIECTFIEDEDIEQAIKTHHMHWIWLKPYILSHPNILFILYHFSKRYKRSYLEEFFKKESLDNIIAWIN